MPGKRPKDRGMKNKEFSKIPALNKLLNADALAEYRAKLRPEIFKKLLQSELNVLRDDISKGKLIPTEKEIIDIVQCQIAGILQPSLRKVVNATGVILHRSEERRVGKECRSRWSTYHYKKKYK